jgi:hypothetical protein
VRQTLPVADQEVDPRVKPPQRLQQDRDLTERELAGRVREFRSAGDEHLLDLCTAHRVEYDSRATTRSVPVS